MKNTDYLKIILVTIVTFFSCSGQQNKNEKNNFYIAQRDFGRVSNQIEKTKLDSLINLLPYSLLGTFNSNDSLTNMASKILKDDLQSKGMNVNEFFIYEINVDNDSILVFHLDHLDYLIYKYNLEKLNSVLSKKQIAEGTYETVPPITGNVSGHEGWYKVNFESNEVEIIFGQ